MPNSKYRKILASVVVVSALFISGCGLIGGEEKVSEIDPPKEVTYTDQDMEKIETTEENAEKEETEKQDTKQGEKEAVEETIKTELYLIDKNGYVVPQTLDLPKTTSIATLALEYLVKDGPVTEILPNGFQAVIPAETKVSVNVKDKVATVDFSREFKDYQAEDEMKILQSITWTLTQFDSIEKVKLQMNGHPLEEMPVNGTPIGGELSRNDGINLDVSDSGDITNTRPVTVYYIGGEKEQYYYVPVTKRVSNNEQDNITAAVNKLIDGPNVSSKLLNEFRAEVKLLEDAQVKDGLVTLDFNESIYNSFEEKRISEHVLNTLVLSLTEQPGIEGVAVTVNGKADLVDEEGKKLTEPVTRPEKVNTGSF